MTSYLFSPTLTLYSHNEPSREEEFLNNQSVSVQSVCLMECKQRVHGHTLAHSHICEDTLMHNGVWPCRRLQTQRVIVTDLSDERTWTMNQATILIGIGLRGGPLEVQQSMETLWVSQRVFIQNLLVCVLLTLVSLLIFFTHKMSNVCHFLEKSL